MASRLKNFTIPSFKKFYNSYVQSKSMVEDTEIPYGKNVWPDDNGSASKRSGSSKYGGEVVSGKAITGMGIYKTPSVNELIVSAGTLVKKKSGASWSTLTGFTFTTGLDTEFQQALDRLYIANGTNNLVYYDNATLTEVAANGNVGKQVVFWNQRLYMTNTTYPDRIYFSNPYATSPSANPPTLTLGDFGTFDVNLAASPVKNAGFIQLDPLSGVVITKLKIYGDCLYAFTRNGRGIWKIGVVATLNADSSLAHTINVIVNDGGTPSPRSVFQVGNDLWHFDYDNYFSLGEVAQYQNIRKTTKGGRIKSEMSSITTTGKNKVAGFLYDDKAYISYQVGTYNDRIIVWDARLNAWSCPFEGINASCFISYEESDSTRRLLAGSSNSASSYVYELDTGTNDGGTAISAKFETKSTDCGSPGLIKRFAFIDVFYSMVYGKLTYEVFIDEVSSITGELQLGNSTDRPVGMGSMIMGSFIMGKDYDPNTTFADLSQNDNFRIETNYEPGKKISVRSTNSNLAEQFKINGIVVHFLLGNVNEV